MPIQHDQLTMQPQVQQILPKDQQVTNRLLLAKVSDYEN